jgi:hypothetical protein
MPDVNFPTFFLVLSRFGAFLSDGSEKTLHKLFTTKKRVEKLLKKKIDNRPKIQNRFFSIVLSRFWAFLGRESENPTKKCFDPATFSASDLRTYCGGPRPRFVFAGPTAHSPQ